MGLKCLDKNNRGKWNFFFVIIFILENLATVFLSMATLTKWNSIKTLNIRDNFLKEILLILSEINFEQQLTSERFFFYV